MPRINQSIYFVFPTPRIQNRPGRNAMSRIPKRSHRDLCCRTRTVCNGAAHWKLLPAALICSSAFRHSSVSLRATLPHQRQENAASHGSRPNTHFKPPSSSSCATLAFPETRGESVRATPTSAATCESAGEKTKHHRSRDAAGIRGMRQAARNRHETSAFERSWSEAGGGVRPFIPIQARKAKKDKEERRKAERRQTRSPRSALRRGAR